MFKKYSDIENTYRKVYIDNVIARGLSGGNWIVEEKIHGSNFSLIYDGTKVSGAKRTEVLGDGYGSFYGHETILTRYETAIKKLWDLLVEYSPQSIQVYGELFGGSYPHPDVPRVNNAKKVQSGVFYSPDNQFIAFDLRLDGNYMPIEKAKDLMHQSGFMVAQTLFKGSLSDAMAYSNLFQTTIPELFGLPAIEGNTCEGVVIKPADEVKYMGDVRVVFKNKNEKFSERSHSEKPPRPQFNFSDEASTILDELCSLVTENRLHNVMSKLGPVTDKEFGKIIGAFSKDVMDEYLKDSSVQYDELENEERKRLQRVLQKDITDLIRKNFLNIVDGVF